jgi:ATP-binding cassette subfamily B protein
VPRGRLGRGRRVPAVTVDRYADLFRHLGGRGPAFFAGRSAGVQASRVIATANASYTTRRNTWHTLPSAVAVGFAVALLASVDPAMAAALAVAKVAC